MSQPPPPGSAGTPDETAEPQGPGHTEPTESFAHSPYDVPASAGPTAQIPVGATADPGYGQAPDPTRTIYSGTSSTEPGGEPQSEPGRPRWVVPLVIAVILLLVIGGVVAAFVFGDNDDDPAPVTPTDEVTEEAGTSQEPTDEATEEPTDEATEEPTTEEATTEEPTTEEPTEDASTELLDDLVESVNVGDLSFDLTDDGFTADDDILDEGALEAWRGVYASGDAEIEMLATLWSDNDAADEFAATTVEDIDGEQVETGDTYTNETGTFWAFLLEDGRGSYVWTTDRGHVLQVIGSTDYVGGFYSNFPL